MDPKIDDLLECFDTKVGLKKTSNDLSTDKTHPHYAAMYKNCDSLRLKQQQRRADILLNQKSKRHELLEKLRRFVSEVNETTEEFIVDRQTSTGKTQDSATIIIDEQETSVDTSLDSSNYSINPGKARKTQSATTTTTNGSRYSGDLKRFRNKIMLSEWLIDRPIDFETDWILKPIPVGKRCLVIANKGLTVAYSRTGRFLNSFYSQLPSGSPCDYSNDGPNQHCKKRFAIVDCIFVQSSNTFYLLDIISWNSLNLYESEAQFRFFWLKSKYEELKEKLSILGDKNQYKFRLINSYSTVDEDLKILLHGDIDNLSMEDDIAKLDGLLYFHCRGPYIPGHSSLVLWLKPSMIKRVLGLKIP